MRTLPSPSAALCTALILCACASTESAAPTPPPASAPDMAAPPDMATVMAQMAEYATPGPEHAAMAQSVGHWNVTGNSYWEPGGEPMQFTATAEHQLLLGGRVLQETFHSDFMGQPFEGILLQGYDNMKRQYWSVWVDSMSTWGSYSTGNYNEQGELVLEGLQFDAMSPEGRLARSVVRQIDADHANMKMYNVYPDGTAALSMEFDYTRAP